MSLTIVVLCIFIGLLFSFMNGMNDAANCIATVIATKALSPIKAVIWAAFWQFTAAFIFPVAVATMMGEGIADASCISYSPVFSDRYSGYGSAPRWDFPSQPRTL